MEREEKIKWMKAKQGKERRNYEDMKNRWDLVEMEKREEKEETGEKEMRARREWRMREDRLETYSKWDQAENQEGRRWDG